MLFWVFKRFHPKRVKDRNRLIKKKKIGIDTSFIKIFIFLLDIWKEMNVRKPERSFLCNVKEMKMKILYQHCLYIPLIQLKERNL